MQLTCESRLYAIGCDFAGGYSPYQGIHFTPGPGGIGVIAAASDRGALTFVGYDEAGTIDEPATLLPTNELAAAAKGLKSGPRTLSIDTDTRIATVVTHLKTKAGKTVEMAAPPVSTIPFPDIHTVITNFVAHWEGTGQVADTCGRYDAKLLLKALRAAEGLGDTVVLTGMSGGPLLVNIEGSGLLLMLMAQTAQPLPPPPGWAKLWARSRDSSGETVDTGCTRSKLVEPCLPTP